MADINQLDVGALVEMGFQRDRVVEAIKATKNQGIPPALEWLFNHPIADPSSGQKLGSNEEDTSSNQRQAVEATTETTTEESKTESSNESATGESSNVQQALSLKCEDCGKLIKSEMDAQSHAARTGHQNFAESTEEIKPLTEEEKIAQRERLQQKLEERRKQRLEEEKQKERDREKTRRRTGKEITQAKEEQAYQEMKRVAEERRREKMEEKMLKKKLKEEIARDRAEMKAKSQTVATSPVNSKVTSPASTSSGEVTKKEYDTCRIQFRLTDGKTINETFKAIDTLQTVHLFIAGRRTDLPDQPFSLSTTFPRRTFQADDMCKTLTELKLVPSTVLVLGKV